MERIGDILLSMGEVTKEDLERALEISQETGRMLGKVLVEEGVISENVLLMALAKQLNMQYYPNLKDIKIQKDITKQVPVKLVWHYKFMPIEMKNDTVTIAISDPLEISVVEDIKLLLGLNAEVILAPRGEIMEAIGKYYGVGADTVQKILEKKEPDTKKREDLAGQIEQLEKGAGDASVIKLVDQILAQAVKSNATDLHFENFRNKVSIRARIDGVLSDLSLPADIRLLYPSIISRIKIISGLDVVEKRLPQDGRVKLGFQGRTIDLRVSVIPATHGENIVIRLLPSDRIYELESLGFNEDDLVKIRDLIRLPVGIIFLAGPTGSGKTTTLYAAMSEIKSPKTKIITIEDPVEYEMDDIMQIQVSPKIGLTFANCLRSVLRHDPDIMMVGEVRDSETAELAIRSALTGHLIFSTMHTNDSTGGIARLKDMGVEPFLIVSAVKAIIAQRLVRVICPECKVECDISVLKGQDIPVTRHYRGEGCEACRFTGYQGRTSIYELFILNDEIKEMILKNASNNDLRVKAREAGMRQLRENGWEKVENGVTTVEEILRVTEREDIKSL